MAEKSLLATCPYLEGISGDDSAVADLLTGAQDTNSPAARYADEPCGAQIRPADICGRPDAALRRHPAPPARGDRGRPPLTAVIDVAANPVTATLRAHSAYARLRRLIGVGGRPKAPSRCDRCAENCASRTRGRCGLRVPGCNACKRHRRRARPGRVRRDAGARVCTVGGGLPISARSPHGVTADLGPLVRNLAAACGGDGGGHHTRAGATIPCDQLEAFVKEWQEALAA